MSGVMCHVSGVRCQVSGVTCQVSCVGCHMKYIGGASRRRVDPVPSSFHIYGSVPKTATRYHDTFWATKQTVWRILISTGLLCLVFLNLRSFSKDIVPFQGRMWGHLLSIKIWRLSSKKLKLNKFTSRKKVKGTGLQGSNNWPNTQPNNANL